MKRVTNFIVPVLLILLSAGNIFAAGPDSECGECEPCHCSASQGHSETQFALGQTRLIPVPEPLHHLSACGSDATDRDPANPLLASGDRPYALFMTGVVFGNVDLVRNPDTDPQSHLKIVCNSQLTVRLLC